MKNHLFASLIILAFLFINGCKNSSKLTELTDFIDLDTIVIKANSDLNIYRASEKRDFDIIHTKLEVSFDWDSTYLYGKASILCKPYYYDQSKLVLDAKGFQIIEVALLDDLGIKSPLLYTYDSLKINIELGKTYSKSDSLSVFIKYIAMPNKLEEGGSKAITSDKGLYFINPDGSQKDKPKQIWTQGETQASSCWFPTIDSPNERCTQEIYITVDSIYKTLSNGVLMFQTENPNGTRTDYWKQDKPHAPYLFMMAIGEYAIVKDTWRDKEVNYYVEPKYEAYAREIFPNTVEMIEFFSQKLNYDYPWDKFDQVVVRDYVSGAMENTSAVIYGEFMQGDHRYLIDNAEEDIVAHELFHHWFGDLVTCESWSNLPLNESFATYGEFLWNEHKYGADYADYGLYNDFKAYLQDARIKREKLIRFHYSSRENMFDAHSYQKGGRVLHMLRKYLGDQAFFEGLNLYLKQNKYKSVEIHQLRLAFEELTGEDLNWFFNQWFLSAGHPEIKVTQNFVDSTKTLLVSIQQNQEGEDVPFVFELFTNIELLEKSGKKQIIPIHITKRNQEFEIPLNEQPLFVKIDANNDLLATIDQDISIEEACDLFFYGENYLDRYGALELVNNKSDSIYLDVIENALSDPFWNIRRIALNASSKLAAIRSKSTLKKTLELTEDENSEVRAAAYFAIAENFDLQVDANSLQKGLSDSSYVVVSAALESIYSLDEKAGISAAETLIDEDNTDIVLSLANLFAEDGNVKFETFFQKNAFQLDSYSKYSFIVAYGDFLQKQEMNILPENLSIIEKIGLEDKLWWNRLSAVSSLGSLKNKYSELNSLLQKQISLESDAEKLAKLKAEEKTSSNLLLEINSSLNRMKEKETEKNVLRTINAMLSKN